MSDDEKNTASDLIFLQAKSSKYAKQREHIELIKNACDQMEKDNVRINLQQVVTRSGNDGPAYSTVAPKKSVLGAYIRARADEQLSKISARDSISDSISEGIRDPVLKAQIRDKESEAKWYRRQNVGLRNLLANLSPGLDVDAIIRGTTPSPSTAVQKNLLEDHSKISIELKSVIIKILDHLVGSRNYKEIRGKLTINSKIILDSQDMNILRAATGLTESQWNSRYAPKE